jgi:hypothetical protein
VRHERAARLALMERGRNDELAEVLLDDVALAFELLRAVNTAQVRGAQVSGNGPVLTIRRTVAMIGPGRCAPRRAVAAATGPGPLSEDHAAELQHALDRARRAGRTAMVIRPAGYDGEVVYLVTLLQNLGRLVVQYHFADEATQIRRLMQPAAGDQGEPEEPGMTEQAAAMAVLGVDLEAIGTCRGALVGPGRERAAHDAAPARQPRACAMPTATTSTCASPPAAPTRRWTR